MGILNEKPYEKITNPRILRFKEQTLAFNFTVKYNKGKWHRGPDAMSRIPKNRFCNMLEAFGVYFEHLEDNLHDEIVTLNAITEIGDNVPVSMDDVTKETENDSNMTKLILHIKNGFPATQHLTDRDVRPYFNVKEHLWIQQGIVMFKNRVVIII